MYCNRRAVIVLSYKNLLQSEGMELPIISHCVAYMRMPPSLEYVFKVFIKNIGYTIIIIFR